MDPLKTFRELILNKKTIDSGKIITISNGIFTISTPQGVSTATGDVNLFKVGDSVIILNGVITEKASIEGDLQVFEV